MLGKTCECRWPDEGHFFLRFIVVLIMLSLSGCAVFGGVFTIFIGREEEKTPPSPNPNPNPNPNPVTSLNPSSTPVGGGHKIFYLLPALFGLDCSAACIQRADDGNGCARYSEEAAAECDKFIGEKK